jgi:hypothetical protein
MGQLGCHVFVIGKRAQPNVVHFSICGRRPGIIRPP